jgi:hypothetical protein
MGTPVRTLPGGAAARRRTSDQRASNPHQIHRPSEVNGFLADVSKAFRSIE